MAADPLERLRLPTVPVEPRFAFAEQLLQRLQRTEASPRRETPTVRYFVRDLEAAVDFYCQHLGFEEELRPTPTFSMLYRGDLRLLLSLPVTHAMADGTLPTPGGWNRILIQVADLDTVISSLDRAGVRFRQDVPTGVAVRQVVLEDPS
ncbi:MAG: VOC family protein, partial [Chloroflexi bacterium]|nr:VOC family protein [Chloroflexota bacterium]